MKKIIIVEDDPGIQDAVQLIVKKAGYDITIYPDGTAILNNDYVIPDLFILDKQLIGVDGLDICRYIKNSDAARHVPVVMLSANPNIRRLAQAAGADDVV